METVSGQVKQMANLSLALALSLQEETGCHALLLCPEGGPLFPSAPLPPPLTLPGALCPLHPQTAAQPESLGLCRGFG